MRGSREGLGDREGLRRVGVGSGSPGCSYEDGLIALDLLDFVAADEDLQLAASSFEGVEVQVNLDGVSGRQSPKAESHKESVRVSRSNCWGGRSGFPSWLGSTSHLPTPQSQPSPKRVEKWVQGGPIQDTQDHPVPHELPLIRDQHVTGER